MSRTIKAIERHMIPQSKGGICSVSLLEARCRMAATRTRNTFRTRTSKVALAPCADAVADNRECGRLAGVMITMSIFWVLVLVLFAINLEQPN